MDHGPQRRRGVLDQWNDERGFGFVAPEDGGPRVFLHIVALPQAVRRPEVGDTVRFPLGAGPDGRPRALEAHLEGVALLPDPSPRRGATPRGIIVPIAAFLTLVAGVATTCRERRPTRSVPEIVASAVDSPIAGGGPIKGNISVETGERLYHVPGMRDYEITRIDLERGKRWFRTEAEAQAAGWRRADRH